MPRPLRNLRLGERNARFSADFDVSRDGEFTVEEYADLFEERLQTMLLDGVMKELADSGQPFDEGALQELQKRLLSARSSNDLIQWPVPRMQRAWTIWDFVEGLLVEGLSLRQGEGEGQWAGVPCLVETAVIILA